MSSVETPSFMKALILIINIELLIADLLRAIDFLKNRVT